MDLYFPPLLFLVVAAALAPIVGIATRGIGLSIVVLELLIGIVIGPQGLALVSPTVGWLPGLSRLGMAFLFFIAGLEIDLPAIRGRPVQIAFLGWTSALLLAAALALGMRATGLIQSWVSVAIALVTTALGVVVPILRDAGATGTPLGRNVLASGVMGELGPIIAMSVALSRYSADVQAGLTLAFVLGVLALAWLLARGAKVPVLLEPLRRGLDHSGQLPIRLAFVLVVALAALAEDFGLDLALGALAAGMMTSFAIRGGDRIDDLHSKLDAIGFGFLVPIFFLSSGMKLDVRSILAGTEGWALLGTFLAALILVRAPLFLLLRGVLGARRAGATAFFSATTLSLIVVLTQIAVEAGAMPAAEAAPLVGAGMLSVIIFPTLGSRIAGMTRGKPADDEGRDGL